jgi:hypothetical protein
MDGDDEILKKRPLRYGRIKCGTRPKMNRPTGAAENLLRWTRLRFLRKLNIVQDTLPTAGIERSPLPFGARHQTPASQSVTRM